MARFGVGGNQCFGFIDVFLSETFVVLRRIQKDLVPEGLLNHCEGVRNIFPKIGTKFDAHSLFLSLIHRENPHSSRTGL
jgi:hypothetical protein